MYVIGLAPGAVGRCVVDVQMELRQFGRQAVDMLSGQRASTLQVAQQGDDLPLALACQQLREVLEG